MTLLLEYWSRYRNHKENMPLHESRATFGIYAMAAIVVEDKLIIIAVAIDQWIRKISA